MFDRYRRILSMPGTAAFTFAGLLSRLPMSMVNISIILMVQIQYSSYAVAGRVAAIGTFVWAAQTVPTARIVDRFGQRAAMWPMVGLHVAGVVVGIATAMTRGPETLLWVAATLASLSGPIGSLTRARWSHVLADDRDINTAFSLEGALDETLFISGPAAATVLATSVHPAAGLVVSTTALIVGMLILLSQTSTEPPSRRHTTEGGLGLRVPRAVLAVTGIALALGLVFGALDISTVAFADAEGHKRFAGLVLGVGAFGSFLGGLANGAIDWRIPLWKRVAGAAVFVAVGFSTAAVQPNLILFAAVAFVAGTMIAPLIAGMDNTTQRAVRKEHLNEGLAWLRIGIGIGVGIGAWLSGILIESVGARAGLLAGGAAATLVAVVTLSFLPWLKVAGRDPTVIEERLGLPPIPPNV